MLYIIFFLPSSLVIWALAVINNCMVHFAVILLKCLVGKVILLLIIYLSFKFFILRFQFYCYPLCFTTKKSLLTNTFNTTLFEHFLKAGNGIYSTPQAKTLGSVGMYRSTSFKKMGIPQKYRHWVHITHWYGSSRQRGKNSLFFFLYNTAYKQPVVTLSILMYIYIKTSIIP